MIAEDKVTEIFCIADDFCKEFEHEIAKNAVEPSPEARKRRRRRRMSDAEIITILICFHYNSFRNFKHYYQLWRCSSTWRASASARAERSPTAPASRWRTSAGSAA